MNNMKKNPKKLALNLSSPSKSTANKAIVVPPLIANNEAMQHKNDLYKQGPACILPNLYLGAYYNALNSTQLIQLNISCIINVASEVNITVPANVEYHHIYWTHSQNNLARAEFSQAITKIESAHNKQQSVLIHCQQGIERSAALVIAYLLCTSHQLVKINNSTTSSSSLLAGQNWTLDRALKYVQEKAPGIRPNMELLYQLHEYEEKLLAAVVPKIKHNIQTRTRRSESIACCNSSSKRLSSSSSLRSLSSAAAATVNIHQRPRAASFRDACYTPTTALTKKTSTSILQLDNNKQVLATASLLVVFVAIYHQQQQKSSSVIYHHHRHQKFEESSISSINNNSSSAGGGSSHLNSSFFLKPVYPIY